MCPGKFHIGDTVCIQRPFGTVIFRITPVVAEKNRTNNKSDLICIIRRIYKSLIFFVARVSLRIVFRIRRIIVAFVVSQTCKRHLLPLNEETN